MTLRGDESVSDGVVISLVFVAIVISIMGTYLIYTSSISVVNSPPIDKVDESEIREAGQILLVINPPAHLSKNNTNNSRNEMK